jgi:hypothetical protein
MCGYLCRHYISSRTAQAQHYFSHGYLQTVKAKRPIPVTARSKAWVCDRSLAEIAGSNPARGTDVYLL